MEQVAEDDAGDPGVPAGGGPGGGVGRPPCSGQPGHRPPPGAVTRDGCPAHWIGNHESRVRQATQNSLCERALIHEALRQRLVPINMQRFAGIQGLAHTRLQACRTSTTPSSTSTRVASSSSLTLTSKVVPRTEITAVGVRIRFGLGWPPNFSICVFSPYRPGDPVNPSSWADSCETLHSNWDTPRRCCRRKPGTLREPVWTSDNNLPGLYGVADIERPRLGVAQDRYLSCQRDNLGSRFGVRREYLGLANCQGGRYQQPTSEPARAIAGHKEIHRSGRCQSIVLYDPASKKTVYHQKCVARRYPFMNIVKLMCRFSLFRREGRVNRIQ